MNLKIAIPVENGKIFPRFNDTPGIRIYEIGDDHQIAGFEDIPVKECGYEVRAGVVLTHEAQGVICGEIGRRCYYMLREMRKHVFDGASGDPQEAVLSMLRREMKEIKAVDAKRLKEEPEDCSMDCSTCMYHQ